MYGLRIKTPDGHFQIDGEYKNYTVLQRGFAVTGDSNVVNFPAQPFPPLVFIRPAYGEWFCMGNYTSAAMYRSVGKSSFRIAMSNNPLSFTTPSSNFRKSFQTNNRAVSYEYVVLVPLVDDSFTSGAYGLRVRNPNDQTVIFRNDREYFCIDSITLVNASRTWISNINSVPVLININLSLPAPPLGKRFVMLNSLRPYDNIYPVGDDDGSGQLVWEEFDSADMGIGANLISETSVQFHDYIVASQGHVTNGARTNHVLLATGYIADDD
ncbi:hypothetical protein IHQ56_02785 [Methylobacillus flagellatus]|uniref:hypothetical protein n=1 Tax=Methylobacillus flagellatus TaxID=405 RepID=UPI002853F27B|nr:hypothetical protein [Methylobacillus flagellatus]MDR5170736.1 hypothetical protein [Methylobacillus flagellatus]